MIAAGKIETYRALFRGRDDVYARRWTSRRTGRSGYSPVLNLWQAADGTRRLYEPLTTQALVDQHLRGRAVLGIYPLLPDGTSWFLAFDLDGETAFEDAKRLLAVCAVQGIPAYLERSRSGNFHGWIFVTTPIAAWKARRVGRELLKEAGLVADARLDGSSFDRLFPNQDTVVPGGLGNLIALPLQGESVLDGRTEFLDPASGFTPFENQWAFLQTIQRVSEAELLGIDLMTGVDLTQAPLPPRSRPSPIADTPTAPGSSAPSPLAQKLRHVLAEGDDDHAAALRVRAGCTFIQHCEATATTLSEPAWWALATNLAALGDAGRTLFHALSRPYPGYSVRETNAKFDRALADPKPHRCQTIRQAIWDCGRDCGVTSPCGLGHIDARPAPF